jgi:hypothetical protein
MIFKIDAFMMAKQCNDFGECQCIGKHAGVLCKLDAGAEAQYIEDGDVVGEGSGM